MAGGSPLSISRGSSGRRVWGKKEISPYLLQKRSLMGTRFSRGSRHRPSCLSVAFGFDRGAEVSSRKTFRMSNQRQIALAPGCIGTNSADFSRRRLIRIIQIGLNQRHNPGGLSFHTQNLLFPQPNSKNRTNHTQSHNSGNALERQADAKVHQFRPALIRAGESNGVKNAEVCNGSRVSFHFPFRMRNLFHCSRLRSRSEFAMLAAFILREGNPKSAEKDYARPVQKADRVRATGLPEKNLRIRFLSKRNLK